MSVYTLIPLLPLMAFLTLTSGGRWWGGASHKVAIPAIGLSFGLSIGAFVEVLSHGPIAIPLYRLIQSGNLIVDLGLYVDQLTALLLLLVTMVSSVVHVYASRYMIGDPRYNRFFAITSLFTFAMLMLVMSRNLLMLYVFWEVMGLCSYLLIAHWAERPAACSAATKAFLVNAVADVGFGFGVILTFVTFGTLDIPQILDQASSASDQTVNLLGWAGVDLHLRSVTLITLCFFTGAMGKSAQIPFHVWLPFAMEAPTPVSALIHAATMVNAGPFLLVRLSPLIVLSPVAMTIIAVIGATTAVFAGVVSLTQSDVKKILAYSTISHIGFMIMTCGVGAFVVAIFHLLAHGFLKGFLFLSTGNALQVVHAHGHTASDSGRDGQAPRLLVAGALTLACLPPFVIFSGPYESLWTVQQFASAKAAFWVIGLITVFCTGMYLFRGMLSLFQQELAVGVPGGEGPVLTRPRLFSSSHFIGVIVGAIVMSCVLMVLWRWFAQFLAPALTRPVASLAESSPMTWPFLRGSGQALWFVVPLVVALSGWGFAYWLHVNPQRSPWRRSERGKTLYVLFLNKVYVDEIYDVYVVQPTLRLAGWLWKTVDLGGIDRVIMSIGGTSVALARWLWHVVDVKGIDRVVVGSGGQTMSVAMWLWRMIDIRGIEKNVERLGDQVDATGHPLHRVEPRTLQHHLLVIVFWLITAIGLFYWFVA